MFHAPVWATWLILAALPLILGAVLYFWGDDEPDNTIEHHQEGGDGDEPDDMLAAA